MVAGDKRRKVEDSKPITYSDLALKLEVINNQRAACLVALLYLSGRRIHEVLHLQKKDFKIEDNRISFITFNEKNYKLKPRGNFIIKHWMKQRPFKDRKSKPYEGEVYYEQIKPHWRTDSPSGKALNKFILNTLDSLTKSEDYLFSKMRGLGHISYVMAYLTIRFYFPEIWPHLLRHERFTEVARAYKDDPLATHSFTFHKRFDNTLPYIRKLKEEEERI